ncbi:group XIIB secretory phospholipase A2-like protein isoform X3 [Oncorhynchus tshawytscha]|uniref:group XIIB secretory phospholipase A2-like protein isoform X3 n=1 Tax=Oncorhynchus tshawytscha TaxID=74940 RepID=UPI001C3D23B0|nr:group XIIB secretory phospholipase A2-like protein isoform X3 [Oncorhynchus tshawytscha]
MLPRTVSFLLLFIFLSSGMSASLVSRTTREEDGPPAVPTTFRVDISAAVGVPSEVDTVQAGGPVVDDTPSAEAVAEALVTNEPVTDAAVADEVVAEEPVEDTPVADALVADAPVDAFIITEEEKEALITEAMIKELSAQVEKEDLAEETEIQDATLKELTDRETLEKAVEEPIVEAAEAYAPEEDPASSEILVFEAQEEDSGWGLASIRESLQAANGYFDSLVELMGGRNGVCQYKCKYGKTPVHRYGYVTPEPNGCSSNLLGFQFDIGIPAMTQCCNQLDSCYDTCGSNKYRCDSKYRWCLHAICSDLKKSLGFVSKVKACETVADALYNTVWTLGCRSFMNSQREACYCEGEERDEL